MSSEADPRPPRNGVDAVLAGLTSAALVLALGLTGWGLLTPTPQAASTPDAARERLEPAAPVRLRVPSLDVDAPVVPIVLSSDAVLAPPEDPQVVGWWDGSALPGDTTGRVVITGHTVNTGGGALDPLVDLRRGRVLLETASGTQRYRVSDRYVVDYDVVAERARDIFGQTETTTSGARLVLVTCTDWNGSFYESNVIVVAEPV